MRLTNSALEFDGREINHVISVARAFSLLHPDVLSRVSLHCVLPNQPQSSFLLEATIEDAHTYGYFRTLLVTCLEGAPQYSGKTVSVGGKNAIIENLALQHCTFRIGSNHFRQFSATAGKRLSDATLWMTELNSPSSPELATQLLTVLNEIALPSHPPHERRCYQAAMMARLNRLNELLDPQSFKSAVRTLCSFCASSGEPEVMMHLCEAVWFWFEQDVNLEGIGEQLLQELGRAVHSGDVNVSLAAAITYSRLLVRAYLQPSSAFPNLRTILLASAPKIAQCLGRLGAESFLSRSPFYSSVHATCLAILPEIPLQQMSHLLGAMNALSAVPDGSEGLAKWLVDLASLDEATKAVFALLWRFRIVNNVEIVNYDAPEVFRIIRVEIWARGQTIEIPFLISTAGEANRRRINVLLGNANNVCGGLPCAIFVTKPVLEDAQSMPHVRSGAGIVRLLEGSMEFEEFCLQFAPKQTV